MAVTNLSGSSIQDTYQQVIHTDGANFYDGTGSLVEIVTSDMTGSHLDSLWEESGSSIIPKSSKPIVVSDITSSGNISASGTLLGGGLNVYGTSNSHIEVGEYNVGYDFSEIPGLLVTGSGLIISGAMADTDHHNFLKIGNVELVDISNLVHTDMFLIHNAGSFLISSGSDGGSIYANKLIEHTGDDFTMYTKNDASIIQYVNSSDIITVGKTGGTFVANASSTQLVSPNAIETYVAARHIGVFDTNPNTTSIPIKSIPVDTFFTTVTGAVTASAVSSSGDIIGLSGSFDRIDIGDSYMIPGQISATSITSSTIIGTLQTPAQPNITSVGTLTAGTWNADIIPSAKLDEDTAHKSTTQTFTGAKTINKRVFAAPGGTDGNQCGDIVQFGTSTVTKGRIYFYDADGLSGDCWTETNATTAANSKGLLAVAMNTGNASLVGMCIKGRVNLSHVPGTAAEVLYLSEITTGQATSTAPTGNNEVVRIIGYALDDSGNDVWFDPDHTYVEVTV